MRRLRRRLFLLHLLALAALLQSSISVYEATKVLVLADRLTELVQQDLRLHNQVVAVYKAIQ
jgi:hypothetical protein